jgi:hypothetical protein
MLRRRKARKKPRSKATKKHGRTPEFRNSEFGVRPWNSKASFAVGNDNFSALHYELDALKFGNVG